MQKIKRLLKLLRGNFKEPLPTGKTQLEDFIAEVISIYKLPDHLSYHRTIATMILHTASNQHKASKRSFAIAIKKAMANQVAFAKIEELKQTEDSAERG
jgi:hypothetical protein